MNAPAEARPTIFALSSGALPAGIAVVRISGTRAAAALAQMVGRLPQPRRASAMAVRDREGESLDHALILWMPGPRTATGEDVAELHLHGGRAVVASVLAALGSIEGLRLAEAGEFTRRAFLNGRLDLAQAEGLSDLLAAETEGQRRQAMRLAEGGLGRLITCWHDRLLGLSARVEAAIEFGEDEDDVPQIGRAEREEMIETAALIAEALGRPPAERLRDGIRVVVAGPANAGKSSLINYLAGRDVAIASAVAGTTRDLVEAHLAIDGVPFVLTDSAGLRETDEEIERIGIERTHAAIDQADIILWLGAASEAPDRGRSIIVASKADLSMEPGPSADVATSTVTGRGFERLRLLLIERSRTLIPVGDSVALNARHRALLAEVRGQLDEAILLEDPVLVAEHLRSARFAMDRITGRAGVEDMLDGLFGTFCIGK